MTYPARFSAVGVLILQTNSPWGTTGSWRGRRSRGVALRVTVVMTLLGVVGISPAVAAAAKTVSVTLSSETIVANGKSTSVATATVTNGKGPVVGDQVKFSSSSGQGVSATTNNKNGTYTATVTATTTAGTSTITATDTTPNPDVSGAATLVQAPGPAARVVVRLSPAVDPCQRNIDERIDSHRDGCVQQPDRRREDRLLRQ